MIGRAAKARNGTRHLDRTEAVDRVRPMPELTDPTADQLATLARMVGERHVRSGSEMERYLVEPRGLMRGRAAIVLCPGTTERVAEILRFCVRHRIGIVPHGGGTGVVGGQVSPDLPPGIVLSLERMDKIRAVLPEENALLTDAGVTLSRIREAAEAADRLFPLSLASEGSCQIGGNLATNAGGVQVLRYGNARDLCLGIEAVLPDGSILHGLKTLRKDNTGYDLRNLLIGAEGTLGVITGAALKLFPRPGTVITAMLSVPSPEQAITLLRRLQGRLGDNVTAFELIKQQGVAFLRNWPDFRDPLSGDPPWRVLAEVTGPADSGLETRFELAMEDAFARGLAGDGVMASSMGQRADLWAVRERLPEGNRRIGAIASHDIALPIARIPEFITRGDERVATLHTGLRINCFGHLGDGNLHYNIFPPEGERAADHAHLRPELREAVHDLVHALGGSISAEHGIGRFKAADLMKYGDPAKLAAMRAIKQALDPYGIMNPGAVLVCG